MIFFLTLIYAIVGLAAVYIYSIYNTADMLKTIEPSFELSATANFIYTAGKKLAR